MNLPIIKNDCLAEVAKLAKELLHILVGDAKVEVVDEQLGRAIAATGRRPRSTLPMIDKIRTFRLKQQKTTFSIKWGIFSKSDLTYSCIPMIVHLKVWWSVLKKRHV